MPRLDVTQLLHSRKYSDMTLVCEGIEFNVHKAIVCPQSSVLAAAVEQTSQEGINVTIKLGSFDAQTAERFIQYLYTGDYDIKFSLQDKVYPEEADEDRMRNAPAQIPSHPPPSPPETDFSVDLSETTVTDTNVPATKAHSCNTAFVDTELEDTSVHDVDSPASAEIETGPLLDPETLIGHVRVSAIAEHYKVEALKHLAISKFQEVSQANWNAAAFIRAAKYVVTSTSEEELHDSMALTASSHMKDLLAYSEMEELISPFGVKLFHSYIQRMEEAKTDLICCLRSLKRDRTNQRIQLDTASRTVRSMYNSLVKCRDSLVAKRRCPNPNCQAEAPIRLEHGVRNSWFWLTIKCTKCGRRR